MHPARRVARANYYVHLWGGVLATVSLVVITLTGILLNHKRALGLMPDVPSVDAPFVAPLPLDSLAGIALAAAGRPTAPEARAAAIDRMDARPRAGYVKVRLRDRPSTEVTVALASGRVLHVGARGDVFLEQLHSGEVFGSGWILLSDIAGVLLLLVLLSGLWLWLWPRLSRGTPPSAAP